MLCPGDARVVRRDRALPGLEVLLDPDAFGAVLSRLCGTTIVGVTPTYARYKPGTSCLVGYDVRTASVGPGVAVYARTHAGPDAIAKIRKVAEQPGAPGPLGAGVFVAQDPPLAIFVFPNDHVLRALARLAERGERTRLLGKALKDRACPAGTSLQPLRYKPERRFVGRVNTPAGESFFVKLYAEEDGSACIANARAFRSQGPLRVARLLGAHERRGLALWEWVVGQPLLDLRAQPARLVESSALVGEALAIVHRQNATVPGTYIPARRAEILAESQAAVAAISPDHATRAQLLAGRLACCFAPRQTVSIHGDFSAAQVLLTGDSATLLDFDRAGKGPAELDLGSLMADLERGAITGELSQAGMSACTEGLLAGYARSGSADEVGDLRSRARAATAFSLFRIAVEPFRRRRADWPELLDAFLTRVEVLLGGS